MTLVCFLALSMYEAQETISFPYAKHTDWETAGLTMSKKKNLQYNMFSFFPPNYFFVYFSPASGNI